MPRPRKRKDLLASDYPKVTVRLEPELRARFEATTVILGVSRNQFITDAVADAIR